MIQLAAKLWKNEKGFEEYGEKALKVWDWIQKMQIVNLTTYEVYDGISVSECACHGGITYTYTAGTLLGGMIELHVKTKSSSFLQNNNNATIDFLSLALRIADSAIRLMTKDGVLVEHCDLDQSCNLDQQIFKGIFVRNLRYLIDKLGEEKEEKKKGYRNFLKRNAASLRKNAMCSPTISNTSNSCHIVYMDGSPSYPASGPVFDSWWLGPYRESRPIQQTAALDLLLAVVEEGVICSGEGCTFNPSPATTNPLSCSDSPCPTGQDCCGWEGGFTCCATNQHCQQGLCQ